MSAAAQIEALGKLPVRAGAWEVGVIPLMGTLRDRGPAMCAVCANGDGTAGLSEPFGLSDLISAPGFATDRLLDAMVAMAIGPAARPAPVRHLPSVLRTIPGNGAGRDALDEAIQRLGVRLEAANELEWVDDIAGEIHREIMGLEEDEADDEEPLDIPTLARVKGLDTARLRSFAEAAAAFWRARPWEFGDEEIVWRIEPAPAALRLPLCATMGGLGEAFGLAFVLDYDEMAKMARDIERGRPPKMTHTLWSVDFEPAHKLPPRDLELWERRMLPVAAPDAYPVPFGLRPGGALRPTPAQLTEMELALRAVAALTPADLDRGEATREFTIFGGPRQITLRRQTLGEDAPAELRLAQ